MLELDTRSIDRLHDVRRERARPLHHPNSELLRRAQLLLPDDRRMIELMVRNQLTYGQLARIVSRPRGTVSRRLRRVVARLHDPLVCALLSDHCPLAPEFRQLGIERHLQGRRQRELADRHGMTLGQVRAILNYIGGWFKGTTRQ